MIIRARRKSRWKSGKITAHFQKNRKIHGEFTVIIY